MGSLFRRIMSWLGREPEEGEGAGQGLVWKVESRNDLDQVVVYNPREFGDTEKISQDLAAGYPVIVNLEKVPYDEAQRIIDYLSGTVYYLEGHLQKAGEYIFLFTPPGVDVDAGDLIPGGQDGESPFW